MKQLTELEKIFGEQNLIAENERAIYVGMLKSQKEKPAWYNDAAALKEVCGDINMYIIVASAIAGIAVQNGALVKDVFYNGDVLAILFDKAFQLDEVA